MPNVDELLPFTLAFGLAFLISIIIAPSIISKLRLQKIGQTISEDGPESHLSKAGTPTMGGIIMLPGIIFGAFLALFVYGRYGAADYFMDTFDAAIGENLSCLVAVSLLIVSYALLGLIDDYLTIRPIRGVRGIASKPKAAIQFILASLFVVWLLMTYPRIYHVSLDFAGIHLFSGYAYLAFAVFYIVGMANFVNITDGLDGLVSGLVILAVFAFALIASFVGRHVDHSFCPMAVALFFAIAGACLAFLWFNTNPARVFMGDTGSLALGVALPAIAILTHREILMIIICSVFVMDGLSTAIQWAVFKFTRITTGTGRRVFKKSPIHHHFELCGWPEQTVTVRFWIMGVIAAVIAFAGAVYGLW